MPTVRDIVETIEGLQTTAKALRKAAESAPIGDTPEKGTIVAVSVVGLMGHVGFLEKVVEELRELVPDTPVELDKG